MKALRLQQSAAERFTRAEHALYYPSIGVVGTAGFVPTAYETVPGRYGAIGMNSPFPSSMASPSRPGRPRPNGKPGGQQRESPNRVIRDVRVAWLNATTAYDRMGLTQELLEQARSSLDLAQTRYDLGLGDTVELSTVQPNLTSAQIADTSAHYEYQTQRIVLDFQTEPCT